MDLLGTSDFDAMMDVEFFKLAMADIYGFSYAALYPHPIRMHSLSQCERLMYQQLKVPNKNVSTTLENHFEGVLKWKAQVFFHDDKTVVKDAEVRFLPPEIYRSSNLFWRYYGSNRFLSVDIFGDIPSNGQYFQQHSFFQKDIIFGGRRYRFIGGEKCKARSRIEEETLVDGKEAIFTAWYFAEKDVLLKGRPEILMDENCPETSVHQVRSWLADFSNEKSFSKLNARLKLGFSMTLSCISVEINNVIIIDDIVSKEGNIMTDGCGFIHASLVDSVPYGNATTISLPIHYL